METLLSTSEQLQRLYGEKIGKKYHNIVNFLYGERYYKTPVIEERLLNQKTTLNQSVVDELQHRSNKAQNPKSKNVAKAREILHDFFHKPCIRDQILWCGVIPIYTGSIQYDDPRNLDADVAGICLYNRTDPDNPFPRRKLSLMIHYQLLELWEKSGLLDPNINNEPHFNIYSIPITESDIFYTLSDPFQFMNNAEAPSLALSSISIYPEKGFFDQLHETAIFAINTNPINSIYTNIQLEGCLKIRQERQHTFTK
jgi:hypothetical protein